MKEVKPDCRSFIDQNSRLRTNRTHRERIGPNYLFSYACRLAPSMEPSGLNLNYSIDLLYPASPYVSSMDETYSFVSSLILKGLSHEISRYLFWYRWIA
jgi:hypothetical protein